MNTNIWLAAILFVLMIAIGGKKGVRSFIALFINFIIVLLAVFIMGDPLINPIYVTIMACIGVSSVNLFYINQINSKTITAFFSTMITIFIMLILIYFVIKKKIRGLVKKKQTK